MKRIKFFMFVGLMVLFMSVVGYALVNFTYSSGLKSSSGVIVNTPVLLTDLAVYTNGSNDATVTLYDNASNATGTVIAKVTVTGSAYNGGVFIPVPVKTQNGIYMSISGTGANAIVYWTPE